MAADAATAVVQANGAFSPSARPTSPQSTGSTTAKRKREPSDDGSDDDEEMASSPEKSLVDDSNVEMIDERELIRDYFQILQSHDSSANLLKRPLPSDAVASEPQPKRQRSLEPTGSIADKVSREEYEALDELVSDIKVTVKSRLAELQEGDGAYDDQAKVEGMRETLRFEAKAEEMFHRESSYPNDKDRWRQPVKSELREALPSAAMGHQVLTVWGMGVRAMPFFSSVPRSPSGGAPKAISEKSLPSGVTLTRITTTPIPKEKASTRPLTLGELFPSPRGLPPLQPPKVAKTSTKGNVLNFYHPELTEKSRYRGSTYFSADITAGHYLDYSNAAPSSQIKTRQRERAQSLAGHKPSSTELVNSETEALFRGAFSSFAPCKDDSGAIVSSGQAGRLWWNKVGHRALDRMIEAELPDDESDGAPTGPITPTTGMEVDDVLIQETLDRWDDMLVDPSLDEMMGKKSDADKDLDDMLDEVSDLIETLASFQWNRNLTLPTSQDRQSMDPINGDMLRNASSAHQPSEDETLTYQALQSQLALIIQDLPPYAVARLNSDKLAELNVSTKIPLHMDEYRGVVEEDDSARTRPQQAAPTQQAVATPAPRPASRTPSIPGLQYTPQYGAQYGAGRAPMASPQGYSQTPGRPVPPNMYGQRPPTTVPVPLPHGGYRPTPPGPNSRPPNGYTPGYGSQLARSQASYGQGGMPAYPGSSPGQQPRMAYPQASTPTPAYPAGYRPGGQPQQARPIGGYPYANGTPTRNITPHGGAQGAYYGAAQQQMGQVGYGAGIGATPPPQRTQDQIQAPARATAAEIPRRFAAQLSASPQSHQQHQPQHQHQHQHQHHQQQPRPAAGPVSGLQALGIQGGQVDMIKLAAARARSAALGGQGPSLSPSQPNAHAMAQGMTPVGQNPQRVMPGVPLGAPPMTAGAGAQSAPKQ